MPTLILIKNTGDKLISPSIMPDALIPNQIIDQKKIIKSIHKTGKWIVAHDKDIIEYEVGE